MGTNTYTRGVASSLPINDNQLGTEYSAGDLTNVATSDDVRVSLYGPYEYMIHQFKNDASNHDYVTLSWEGRSSLAPSSSPVYLQIYNQNSTTWETVASNSVAAASTDFTLTANVSGLTNYKNGDGYISCRVYQWGDNLLSCLLLNIGDHFLLNTSDRLLLN
jgi:hypothetical protein